MSPWASRRLLTAAGLGVLLLIPLWLDPATLRELRSATPSSRVPVNSMDPLSSERPLPTPEADPAFTMLVASDTFDRAFEHGLPGYSSRASGFAGMDVSAGRAMVRVGTDGEGWAVLESTDIRDVDATITVAFPAEGEGTWSAGLVIRDRDQAGYEVRFVTTPAGTRLVADIVSDNWSRHSIADVEIELPTQPNGISVLLRVQATGSDPAVIRARAWVDGMPEPATWQLRVVDWTGRLQRAGRVGLSWLISGAAQGGVDISYDNLIVLSGDSESAE